jgi:hypothetical protein
VMNSNGAMIRIRSLQLGTIFFITAFRASSVLAGPGVSLRWMVHRATGHRWKKALRLSHGKPVSW